MNVPSSSRTPRRPPRTVAEAELFKYQPAQERSSPWEEGIIKLATFEDYEED
jgi:hypothetical protein